MSSFDVKVWERCCADEGVLYPRKGTEEHQRVLSRYRIMIQAKQRFLEQKEKRDQAFAEQLVRARVLQNQRRETDLILAKRNLDSVSGGS